MRIMFVCLGNICRSPAAQAVMQALVNERGVSGGFEIDSAGTASYHIGRGPDPRMIAAGAKRGLQFGSVAKAFSQEHATHRDLVLAMDRENLRGILAIARQSDVPHVRLLSHYLDDSWPTDVPDPYYG
ncbi:MAG: low molecular weight protein-tyrosine-phosphatase, partial [Pirellula sp.]